MPPTIRNFTRVGDAVEPPGLNSLQARSYADFLQPDVLPSRRENKGLERLFREAFPVEGRGGALRAEYLGYDIGPPAHSLEECRRLGLTYAGPLRARLRVCGAEATEEDVYFGDVPLMVGGGEFVVNGAERVVVAQIQRSAGIDFAVEADAAGGKAWSCRIVPERGTWIEFEIRGHGHLQARLGQSGKLPGTWLLRAVSPEASSDAALLALFYGSETVALQPGGGGEAGRFLAGEIVNEETGEVLARAGAELTPELSDLLLHGGLGQVETLVGVDDPTILRTLERDPARSHEEAVLKIYARFRPGAPPVYEKAAEFLRERLQDPRRYSLGEVGRFRINRKLGLAVPPDGTTLCAEDVVEAVRYLLKLRRGEGAPDDIDHLGNRLLKPVGRLAEDHLRLGFLRMRLAVANALAAADKDGPDPPPRAVCDAKPVRDALYAFFGRSELSQVVDQTNPLSQLAHERRVSALGPGGLSRKRAGYEVRDVHTSHYGRLCPIETPEGPNIGLISSLSLYAGVDQYGFLLTAYRRGDGNGGLERLRADEEEKRVIAPADFDASAANGTVPVRTRGEFAEAAPGEVELLDVSPKQVVGVSGSLIPFLEHNDANRALMGSNMQRQAVPLLAPEPPAVFTGMEGRVAACSSLVLRAWRDGVVDRADARLVSIDGEARPLAKCVRMNDGTCQTQRPLVRPGQSVRSGEAVADGAATRGGELALGRDVVVAFMPFDGYNFEDAVIVSERLVREDVFTSVHVEEYQSEACETRDGREEFTRDIPHLGEEAFAHLDEAGAARVGLRVREGDILVGKVRPKGGAEPAQADVEMLVRAIFGRAAEEVKNASLAVPPGGEGVVIGVEKYAKKPHLNEDERRAAQREARRLQAECDAKTAEALRELEAGLAAMRPAPGAMAPGLAGGGAREAARAAQDNAFRTDAFAEEDRPRAEELWHRFRRAVAEAAAERDRALRRLRSGDDLRPGVMEMARVRVATKRKLQVGDKIAGRHGNKGVIARVLAPEDMPFLPDGTPVDVVLNPLGVPSRMNVGQILETHLGWAAHALGFRALTPVFDGADEVAIRECLREAGLPQSGKTVLYDGRTGERFGQEVAVGRMYLLKLHHLVEEKTHARSTGPYSMITQQPLGGKSRRGGQRVGEMEVWALEAYGASHVLQEMMTVKSDDAVGRAAMYESIVKGRRLLEASAPVSFDVLTRELRGLCMNMQMQANGRPALSKDEDEGGGG